MKQVIRLRGLLCLNWRDLAFGEAGRIMPHDKVVVSYKNGSYLQNQRPPTLLVRARDASSHGSESGGQDGGVGRSSRAETMGDVGLVNSLRKRNFYCAASNSFL